ncbi:Xaa-Pro aminopeptidase [Ectothiorhodospira mobilis]|uniref:Xaa-Pro aminopeptidase n=1 Tax=Ectothiorhodospira mobilis TaxID=195064 RepID=UPI001EE895FF|nr:Xaa-Pro aminopeptidase [Ectothiorhodospira mobilis]MCG5535770.1 Xaa-Pro aminopeptidase [Ectothiorhodospira mobilis]
MIPNKTQLQEHAHRRRRLMEAMGEGAIAIVPGAPERTRNRDVTHPFRQDSDFWYLTGFVEPEAVAVLVPGRSEGDYVLFCRERDPEKETWNGRRAGTEGAVRDFGADEAHPLAELEQVLPGLLEGRERVYLSLGHESGMDRRVSAWIEAMGRRGRAGVRPPRALMSLEPLLHELRLFKSEQELEAMRRAAAVTVEAHRRAMAACRPGMGEYQLEAELLYTFRHAGMEPAYASIVGGGANGCILHYTENEDRLRDGDLVLIDAGCEYRGYAGDVTRTFPVNGRFSPVQRAVYDIVLEAQAAAIAQVAPGRHWEEPHQAAVAVLTRGLVDLGVLQGPVQRLVEEGAYRPYYMHRTGHWLGLDVHDVGDYRVDGAPRPLQPGMVMTVEPGLYFPPGGEGVPEALAGIGVRIEDDVAVTRAGHEVLTADCPKAPEAIEALMTPAD